MSDIVTTYSVTSPAGGVVILLGRAPIRIRRQSSPNRMIKFRGRRVKHKVWLSADMSPNRDD